MVKILIDEPGFGLAIQNGELRMDVASEMPNARIGELLMNASSIRLHLPPTAAENRYWDVPDEDETTDAMKISVREYITQATGEPSVRAIAAKCGMDQSTLFRQLDRGVRAETLIRICRAYEIPVLSALVAAGIVDEREAGEGARPRPMADFSNKVLIQEIQNRLG